MCDRNRNSLVERQQSVDTLVSLSSFVSLSTYLGAQVPGFQVVLSNSRFQGQSVRLVSGIQPSRNERGILISRAKVGRSSPHAVASSAGHPFVHKAVFYTKAHMYLDLLLGNHVACPIGIKCLQKFGLL
jgi:hypothetical protein